MHISRTHLQPAHWLRPRLSVPLGSCFLSHPSQSISKISRPSLGMCPQSRCSPTHTRKITCFLTLLHTLPFFLHTRNLSGLSFVLSVPACGTQAWSQDSPACEMEPASDEEQPVPLREAKPVPSCGAHPAWNTLHVAFLLASAPTRLARKLSLTTVYAPTPYSPQLSPLPPLPPESLPDIGLPAAVTDVWW